ncbi:MAG: aspartate aminotransferase family protein, partial [Sulfobacillus benefaciens]
GGRRDIMQYVAPLGGMFQAGTLAGNPLSSAAGLKTLEILRTTNPYPKMEKLARMLEKGILDLAKRYDIPITINRVGSGFTVFFGETAVVDYDTANLASKEQFARFHRLMLAEGIYLAPSRFEAWFVSAAHQDGDIERTLDAVARTFNKMRG